MTRFLSTLLIVVAAATACREAGPPVAVGTLERHRIELRAERQEPILRLAVREGDLVEAGDVVVREIANRLVSLVRSTDVVHRYGGAIFTILLPDSGLEDGVLVAEKIRSGLAEGAYLQGTVRLGFSLGLTAFTPEEFDDAQTVGMDLFRQADQFLGALLPGNEEFVKGAAAVA